jgi:hypothetical protein
MFVHVWDRFRGVTTHKISIFTFSMFIHFRPKEEPAPRTNQSDREIEEALRILHESRDLVEETTRKISVIF